MVKLISALVAAALLVAAVPQDVPPVKGSPQKDPKAPEAPPGALAPSLPGGQPLIDVAAFSKELGVAWPDFMNLKKVLTAAGAGIDRLPTDWDAQQELLGLDISDCPFGEGVEGTDTSWVDKCGKK